MQIAFDPRDPREVADVVNTLRLLGMIDAAVTVTINGAETLSAPAARNMLRQHETVKPTLNIELEL